MPWVVKRSLGCQNNDLDRQNQAYAPEIQDQQADNLQLRGQEDAEIDHQRQLKMAKDEPKPSSDTK